MSTTFDDHHLALSALVDARPLDPGVDVGAIRDAVSAARALAAELTRLHEHLGTVGADRRVLASRYRALDAATTCAYLADELDLVLPAAPLS